MSACRSMAGRRTWICLAAFGDVVRIEAARGVHLGVKLGRGPGVRLGYSQVANPLYLAGQRSGDPLGRAMSHAGRNIMRATWPEPSVDRRGRLWAPVGERRRPA